MPLKRYLLYYGYIGTFFRGVQKQHCKGIPIKPAETVQGLLEICLSKLRVRPINTPVVVPSSRTDSGVHALCSTSHTDLDFGTYEIVPEQIVTNLNYVLRKNCFTNISVYNARQVPNTFSARYQAVSRTYKYRFAVLKKEFDTSVYDKISSIPLPVLEVDKCLFVLNPDLDLDLIAKGCRKFIGTKDFRSFMGSRRELKDINTVRTIYHVELKTGKPFFPCALTDNFNFYEFEVTGRAFLYRQVRRMVACLLAVGSKQLSLPEIDYLLSNPSKDSWNYDATVPPGHGLFLACVNYNESDMILTEDNQIVNISETSSQDNQFEDECDGQIIMKENQS